jgi:hypothetical protein
MVFVLVFVGASIPSYHERVSQYIAGEGELASSSHLEIIVKAK